MESCEARPSLRKWACPRETRAREYHAQTRSLVPIAGRALLAAVAIATTAAVTAPSPMVARVRVLRSPTGRSSTHRILPWLLIDKMLPAEAIDKIEPAEAAERRLPAEATESTEPVDAMDKALPEEVIDNTEAAEATESVLRYETIDSDDLCDANDCRDRRCASIAPNLDNEQPVRRDSAAGSRISGRSHARLEAERSISVEGDERTDRSATLPSCDGPGSDLRNRCHGNG